MLYKIPIETSARHIHITRKDFEKLYGPGAELTVKKELSQPGQYLSNEQLTVKGPRGEFEKVSILGPFRNETQVEISLTDSRKLGIPGVIRQSGDIAGTPGCTLIGKCGSLDISKGVIVAKRHIHMTPEQAIHMNVRDNDLVCVITKSYERAMIFADVVVRVNKSFRLAMHVDTDEANAFSGDENPYGIIVKLFDDTSYDMLMWMEELESGIYR
ncbi:MAG: phosphate propanoyltransferase [Lachnospiraceae bacterium]